MGLRRIVALVFLFAACEGAPTSPDAPLAAGSLDGRPNILLILTDDQRYDDLAFMPLTLDRISGATFERAYAPTSLCCPARTTIMRGQYAHNHRITDNLPPLGGFDLVRSRGLEQDALPVWIHDAGYATGYFGKYLNGYDEPLYVPPGWDQWTVPAGGSGSSFTMTKVYENGGQHLVAPVYVNDYITSRALGWLGAQTGPWFAYVAYRSPHLPATPAARHAGAFASLSFPRPPGFNAPYPHKGVRNTPQPLDTIAAYEVNYRLRLESLLSVDEGIAAIVDSLAAMGQIENTLVMFTSDNGFMLGEHALLGKNLPYEPSIHVPMLVMGPGVVTGTRSQIVAHIDIAPTLADYAGAAAPSFVDGRSLRPVLEGTAGSWRAAILTEHWSDDKTVQAGMRTDALYYSRWRKGGNPVSHEVYTMTTDSAQVTNRWNATTYGWMRDRTVALSACAAATCRTLEDQGP